MSELRDRIMAREYAERRTVEAFGEVVGVRQFGITAAREFRRGIEALQEALTDPQDVGTEIALITVQQCAIDPDTGELLFPGDEGMAWLRAQPAKALEDLASAALEINGMGADAQDNAMGNSSETPDSGKS